ncbi:hypothetical protein BLNAU_25178 [Blattamonas nauphoetae]|uniref:Uncharacterized protein n=1 Tax=Blattamonas nauphoetae TaxID=2049346 RepID=A0ABQ9WKC0_9EUKA|nr:hypothetical protein BLNAU_25178 [Blattamonas nauphoetae]
MEPSEHDPTEKTVDHSDRTPDTHYGRALTFHSIPPTRPSTPVNLNSSFFGSTPSDTLPATKQLDDPHIALHTTNTFHAPASSSQFRSESSRIISPLRSNAERPERASLLSPQPLTQHNLISALQNCASNSSPTPHHPNLITISSKSHNLETLVQTESTCPPQTNNQTPPFSHLSTSNKVYFGTTNRSSLILNQPSHFSRLPSLDHPARHKTSETESTLHQTAPSTDKHGKGRRMSSLLQRKEL